MKKYLLIGLALALGMACKQEAPRYASASPEIDVIKALVADYEAGNWDAWTGHYADTAKLYHNTTEPSSVAQVRDGLGGLLENVSSYGFQDQDQFYEMILDDQGETWVNFWGNWEGTLSANGKNLVIPVHLTLQLENGKIVEEHAFYNLAEYMAELNAINAQKMAEEAAMEESE